MVGKSDNQCVRCGRRARAYQSINKDTGLCHSCTQKVKTTFIKDLRKRVAEQDKRIADIGIVKGQGACKLLEKCGVLFGDDPDSLTKGDL